MTHGHTRIQSRGVCIYCGTRDGVLTDEHVVPLSLGGSRSARGARGVDFAGGSRSAGGATNSRGGNRSRGCVVGGSRSLPAGAVVAGLPLDLGETAGAGSGWRGSGAESSRGDGATGPIRIGLAQWGQATSCPLIAAGTASTPAQTGQARCTRSAGIAGGNSGGTGEPGGAVKNSAGGN